MHEITLRPESSWLDFDLRALWSYRDLLTLLVRRDFVSKYKQTILGPLWFVLQPLLLTIVFTIVFGKVAKLSTDGLPPLLFYLCGQLAWGYFSQSLTANSSTFVSNAGLFGKVYFPRLVVPLAVLASNSVALAIQALTFAGFFLYYRYVLHVGGFGTSWRIVFLPLLVLETAALSLGVGLLLSALTAKYRDLSHLTPVIVQVWMYATPVIYPLSTFPAKWRSVIALNPMTPIAESYRLVLLGTGTVEPAHIVWSVTATILLLVIGLLAFGRVERTFVDIV